MEAEIIYMRVRARAGSGGTSSKYLKIQNESEQAVRGEKISIFHGAHLVSERGSTFCMLRRQSGEADELTARY
jgi:hypothetical protein